MITRGAKAARTFLLLALWCLPAFAAVPVTVQNLRMWRAPDNTRLVFDLTGSVDHHIFVLDNPNRLVIDLDNARFQGTLPEIGADNPMLSAFRLGRLEGKTLRFVLELKVTAKPRSFVLKPAGQYGHRLVVDLIDPRADAEEAPPATPESAPAPAAIPSATPSVVPVVPVSPPRKREWVIAIDAGHGGEDPGAIGRQLRTREKDVTLAIARELARQLAQEPRMTPVLVREGDYFVALKTRWKLAKHNQADIFVSIHADSMPGRKLAYGSSVYALSERGATNALAAAIADQNNYSDLVGGVSLSDKEPFVKRTIMDLVMEKKMEYSMSLGEHILSELRHVGRVHSPRVSQAGFAVFKSVEIPSVLVETAFISTPEEERKLRDAAYQRQLATAILKGVKRYLAEEERVTPLPQQLVADVDAPREHVVRMGETLASIAQLYKVHVEVLRFLNNLPSNDVAIGLRLRLPIESDGG